MKALLLAGGRASRLNPFTTTRPKPLLPIAGRTILEQNLLQLGKAGVTTAVIVTAAEDNLIRSRFGDGSELSLNIDYVQQSEDSIGGAISAAREKFVPGQYFLLVYADIFTTENIFSNALAVFNCMRAPIASVCLPDDSTRLYGNVYLDEEMRITKIVEKPDQPELGNYVLGGVFMMPYDLFDVLDDGKVGILSALERLSKKYGLYAAIWENDWIDINYPWSILQANKMVMDTWNSSKIARDIEIPVGVAIHGPVTIESDVRICEGAVIRGPVLIGGGTFIGNNALVREYSAVGPGSVIGFGTELKNCVIFGGADVGRISYIGDSVVGEGAKIGSGTMTINQRVGGGSIWVPVKDETVDSGLDKLGAFIGDGAVIGASNTIQAGAVVKAGAVIGDHFTVDRT